MGEGVVGRHVVGLERARRGKVAQRGLIGEAVGEVVKVDRGQEVVGGGAVSSFLLRRLGLQLLGKAEAWVRGGRARGSLARRCG